MPELAPSYSQEEGGFDGQEGGFEVDPGTPPEAGGADLGYGGLDPPPLIQDEPPLTPPTTPPYGTGEQAIDMEGMPQLSPKSKAKSRRSQRPSVRYEEKPIVTRLHMLEFLSQKEWWYEGQNNLGFTIVLWFVFVYIMYTRSGVFQSYNLHLSVKQHMQNIVAHPHLSGIRVRDVRDDPLPCRCACQSASAGMPAGPCDQQASEHLDFLGWLPYGSKRLPSLNTQALVNAKIYAAALGDKLDKGNDDIESMTWDKISKVEDVWFWVEHGFIPDVWRQRTQDGKTVMQGLIAQKNLIIGGLRARQKRAAWSPDCEKKVNDELVKFYGLDCRGYDEAEGSFLPQTASSTVASTTTSNVSATATNTTGNASNTTQSSSSTGYISSGSTTFDRPFSPSTTNDDDGVYDALFNIEFAVGDALAQATFCRKNNWIDAATRTLNLQSVTLNAEIGMFAIIDIEFEFPASGGVEKKVTVHTFHAVGSKIDFMDIMPELVWAGMIGLLVRQEVWQMLKAGWKRECMDYWLDLWCVVDWISIFAAVMVAMFWLLQITSIGSITDAVADLPRSPFVSGPPSDIIGYEDKWQEILDDSSVVYLRKIYYQLSLFWYNLILASRFLKNFLSQPKLAMLQLTVGATFWDLCHLFVFFFMVFLNFQLGGHILFGGELEPWSTMVGSGATATKMLLGTYEFDPMYEVAPVSATCWFWGFLLIIVFIMMNMIFAMVADYFHVIRGFVGDTSTIFEDTAEAARDLWWRLGWRKINIEDGEYKVAFIENPYNEVSQGLMEASQVTTGPGATISAQMERDAKHSCLGIRIGRRHIDSASVEGLDAGRHPGYVEATSKGIQEFGADIMAADHLLELAQPHVDLETKRKNESELSMVRHFLHLLRQHRDELDVHCTELEDEVTEDLTGLVETLTSLESNTKHCMQFYDKLRVEGIHSLAPPILALPRPGTLASKEMQEKSMVAPGALLRAIDNQQTNARKGFPQPDGVPLSPSTLKNAKNESLLAIGDTHGSVPASPQSLNRRGTLRKLADAAGRGLGGSPEKRKDKERKALGNLEHLALEADQEQLALDAPGQPALEGVPGQLALPAPDEEMDDAQKEAIFQAQFAAAEAAAAAQLQAETAAIATNVRCKECFNNFAVAAGSGETVECPRCNKPVLVP